MFIQTEATPNPLSIKFLPGREIAPNGPVEFSDSDHAQETSPLAADLLALDGVVSVMFGQDYIVVNRSSDIDWQALKPIVLSRMMERLLSGPALLEPEHVQDHQVWDVDPQDQEVVSQVCTLLDEHVRPAVARDGGDIMFKGYAQGVVYLTLRGACAGCPSATMTLKMGIENLLRHFVPEVVEVRAVE